ncbi:MAG: hypothetical protein KDD22_03905 [Bdellovibrionales bacterium]|nr:hypothetical protein [Bdellovibrionales bacterium]
MILRKAREDESERLKAYFSQHQFPGPLSLQIQRKGSFFDKYKLYSSDYVTYILEDAQGELQGMASLIFAPGLIDQQPQTLGFATDLRITNSRRAILSWANHFLPLLEQERKERDCRYVFSSVAYSQKLALNAFLRPQGLRRALPRYYLYRRFDVVGLHGRFPWAPKVLPGLKFRNAHASDIDKILAFYASDPHSLWFPHIAKPKNFLDQIHSWLGHQLSHLQVVEDYRGELQATYALWNSSPIEEFCPQEYSGSALTLKESLRFFAWSGLTRTLPNVSCPLKFRYFTHLRVSHPDVFESILARAWQSTSSQEFLLYPHYHGNLSLAPPKSYLYSRWKWGLFCLLAPNDPYPNFLQQKFESEAPLWELAFM